MRVLMLSRNPDRSSSHFRFYQYLPYLETHGVSVEPAPLFGVHHLSAVLDGAPRSAQKIAADYARRLLRMLSAGGYDLLWVQYEAFPWLPAAAEALLAAHGLPYVVDYDDAWFHRYDSHPRALVRRLLGRKIDWVMRHARLVIAGNAYIEDYAHRVGARWVERLPTVVNLADYSPLVAPRNDVFTIGWLGSQTVAVSLAEDCFRSALRQLCRDNATRFVVVGARPPEMPGVRVEVRPWSKKNEAREFMSFDVGVSPLSDSPFERGKCGLKLIQYMAAGRPVVASPVGFNCELVEHCRNGFLVNSTQDWTDALQTLRCDPALRERMGRYGRRMVEEKYCLEATAPKLLALLRRADGQAVQDQALRQLSKPCAEEITLR
jgi:glycosyltransferase involved in cell wall biosynthesis